MGKGILNASLVSNFPKLLVAQRRKLTDCNPVAVYHARRHYD
jgi:hypothetical protein